MSDSQKLTLDQVAEILAMKAVTIKRYVREGLLDGQEENGQLIFEPEKVSRFKELQERLR
ncbi:MerR family transcriptional regulator [Thalassolituus marinus]|uniref:MerR family transcriptional regulator n=1 Tax=Thalassolituus marinus TaxID=671053 RepID=A0ABS7ZUZ7_9GAMM|nr:MerR family transcriptional regulator [Thalassolituus marinus]MCA6064395.1 MerR family transcriptional regulator [Thalassolituus marinus]